MITFLIHGYIREAETGIGISGLLVKAYDKDLLFDDLLGSSLSGPLGKFEIISELVDFRDFFDLKPDIYLRILTPDGKKEIFSTKEGVRWQAGRVEEFDVRIPRELLDGDPPERGIHLLDSLGEKRTDFDVGESLMVRLQGLPPDRVCDVVIRDADDKLVKNRLRVDPYGNIDTAYLWPQMGLTDPRTGRPLTVDEAEDAWRNKKVTIDILVDGKIAYSTSFQFPEKFKRPLVVNTDSRDVVANGFEVGKGAAVVSGYRIPIRGTARVYMVPRQHVWHPGDRFEPVRLAGGRPADTDVEIGDTGRFRAEIAAANELAPGAYDFIVREIRYGYEDDEDFTLRAEDIVTASFTGLVVRQEFVASKAVLGGCVNYQKEMAGRVVPGQPYFQFADTFQLGEDIYASLDPAALDPSVIGRKFALYVVDHKDSAEWTADNSLTNIPELGGNSGVLEYITQGGCINYNTHLIWSNPQRIGEYDIVADFGNNPQDPATFQRDDNFDQPADLIDGYFIPGFRIVKDPGVDKTFNKIGQYEYNENTLFNGQPLGSVSVVKDTGTTVVVPLKAVVYFPMDGSIPDEEVTADPSQISTQETSFPVVVIVHGAGHSYQGYDYLLKHWAWNGFIAASIHLGSQTGTDRARVLFEHLDVLQNKVFGSKFDNNIGLMGHSRGGEGVAIAPRINYQDNEGYNLKAIISLAPTNQYTNERIEGNWATPYLVIYGSMDGDVSGISTWSSFYVPLNNCGFALYDKAGDEMKSMVFAYGANHDRFTTIGTEVDMAWLGPNDVPKVVSAETHQKIALAYMTAFFRWQLKPNEDWWDSLFKGEWIPASVEQAEPTKLKIYPQYEDTDRVEIDNFEDTYTATSWETSTINDDVSHDGTLPEPPSENQLNQLETNSPHETGGLLLRWDQTTDKLRFNIPTAYKNIKPYNALSFRITQKVGSDQNPENGPQDLYVSLEDNGGNKRSIKVSKFAEIPPPHPRDLAWGTYDVTKSAMRTVRIPLHVYEIEVLGAQKVDLSDVKNVTFEFRAIGTGEVEIDSVEVTK
ncbi:MAG: alpha/beta hydrolase [Planctomycetota bacterium]|jgi:hypothetical protein